MFHFFFVWLSVFLVVLLCFEIDFRNAALASIAAYAIQHIGNASYSIFMESVSYAEDMYWACYLVGQLFLLLSYAAIYPLFILSFHRKKSYQVHNFWVSLLIVLICTVSIVLSVVESFVRVDSTSVGTLIIIKIYAILCCLLCLTIQSRLIEIDNLNHEKQILLYLKEKESAQHETMKANIELINIKCHDLKKEIGYLKDKAGESMKGQYIAELENVVVTFDDAVKCGNKTLDVVLTEKRILCRKYGIAISYIVDGPLLAFMDEMDIYSLMTNALDNAIESVRKADDKEKRVISVKIAEVNSFVSAVVENWYGEAIEFDGNGLPKTNKGNQSYHGFGMKSIRAIVKKYGGHMTIETANQIFSLALMFPKAIGPEN